LYDNVTQKRLDYNKKRLIEVSVSREGVFWKCFEDKIVTETDNWQKSDEYKNKMKDYNDCEAKEKAKGGFMFGLGCLGIMPNRPWQLHNEIASKYCSQIADQSQDGQLRNELRKKVPIEVLTDNELSQIVAQQRFK
jgi:hypothetical protein